MFKQESVYGLPAKKKFGCCREVAASKYSTVLDVTTTATKKSLTKLLDLWAGAALSLSSATEHAGVASVQFSSVYFPSIF